MMIVTYFLSTLTMLSLRRLKLSVLLVSVCTIIIKCNKMLRASFAVLLLISSCHCLCEPLQSFADHVENDTSVQNQVSCIACKI